MQPAQPAPAPIQAPAQAQAPGLRRGRRRIEFAAPKARANFPAPYSKLTDVILDDKRDVRFSPAAGSPYTAEDYARKHRLQYRDDDINEDGQKDIILYDRNGNPVYVNGFKLTPSEFKLRDRFYIDYPAKADRARIGGYSNYKRNWHNMDIADSRAQYATDCEVIRGGELYFVPKQRGAPTGGDSVYKRFSSAIVHILTEFLKDYINNVELNKSHLISILPTISLVPIIYNRKILKYIWRSMDAHEEFSAVKARIVSECANDQQAFNALKRFVSKHKNSVMDLLNSEWDHIVAGVNDAYLTELMNQIGFTQALIRDAPTNDQVKNDFEAKAYKIELKEAMITAVNHIKDASISDVFSD